MPQVDWPLPQLREYRPALTREPDFDELATAPLDAEIAPVEDYPVRDLRVSRVTYTGWAGARICAWWLVPPDYAPGLRSGRRPTMVFYHGYGGSKGAVDVYLGWALQ